MAKKYAVCIVIVLIASCIIGGIILKNNQKKSPILIETVPDKKIENDDNKEDTSLDSIVDKDSEAVDDNKNKDSIHLKIISNKETITGDYKKGDKFKCNLLGEEFENKIKNISEKKVDLNASKYGLFAKREDGTISLIKKVKDFELHKNKELVLALQVTDMSAEVTIVWE